MADASQYTPHGVILNRERLRHTVGSGPWRAAVVRMLRDDGLGAEDIALALGCRSEPVRAEIERMRKSGALTELCAQARSAWHPIGLLARRLVEGSR